MNDEVHDLISDDDMQAAVGSKPEPDFDHWKKQHPDAVQAIQSTASLPRLAPRKPSHRGSRVALLATAAIMTLAVGSWFVLSMGDSSYAYGGPIPGVDDVKQLSWTETFFELVTSQDGSETWVETEQRKTVYQHPGLYRVNAYDQSGNPTWSRIKNFRENKMLTIDHRKRLATITVPDTREAVEAPFADVGRVIRDRKTVVADLYVKSVTLGEPTQFDGHDANPITVLFGSTQKTGITKRVYYLDTDSKQLLGIFRPNGPDLEPKELLRRAKANRLSKLETPWSRTEMIAGLISKVEVSPAIDDTTFKFVVPKGYTSEKRDRPSISLQELQQFVRACINFNSGQWPDSLIGAYDSDKINAIWLKEESNRTDEANEVIQWVNQFRMREIYQSPLLHYLEDNAVEGSFTYIGSGLAVGDKDKIVAWFKSKKNQQWIAFYADISIREVSKDDLPVDIIKIN